MLPEIPLDFTGTVTNHLLTVHDETLALFRQYTTEEPMRLSVDGCKGKVDKDITGSRDA